jgi:hypothetical protein
MLLLDYRAYVKHDNQLHIKSKQHSSFEINKIVQDNTRDEQRGFRYRNRSSNDEMFSISQMLERKWSD